MNIRAASTGTSWNGHSHTTIHSSTARVHMGRSWPCPLALRDLVEGSEQLLGLPAADAELAEHSAPSQVSTLGNRCATS